MVVEIEEDKRNSYTPIMVAVAQGRSDLVRLYIANNHDPREAIALAEEVGNVDILRILHAAISSKYDPTFFNGQAESLSDENRNTSCLKNT